MNPYIGNNPYTSQVADIGYPQVNYQGSVQDTSMQDMFQNEALKQMQQLAVPRPVETGGNSMALANALRQYGKQQTGLAPGWQGNQWQGSGMGYTQGTSLNAPNIIGEYTAPANWMNSLQVGG